MPSYPIEILNLGLPSFNDHYEVIRDLNSIQESFEYVLPTEHNRSWGSSADVEKLHKSSDIWNLLKDYRKKCKGFHPYIIAIVHGYLESTRLSNLFGSFNRRENFAVITTHDWDYIFAPPPLHVFLTYYFIHYTMRFICPELESHDDTRDCFFDMKLHKKDIKISMSSGNICDACRKLLEDVIDSDSYNSLMKLVRYMRSKANDHSQKSVDDPCSKNNILYKNKLLNMCSNEEEMNITWLHLSDLHFTSSGKYNSRIVLRSLLNDIGLLIEQKDLKPSFIIISGDIANTSQTQEYSVARVFLDKLLEITGVHKNRLFLVPGNHDVDRNAISVLSSNARSVLRNRDSVNSLLENDDAERDLIFKRFHNYRKFISRYFGADSPYINKKDYFYVKKINVSDKSVNIIGLNSAWLSGPSDDKCQLVLGEYQVRTALDDVADEADLNLAVMHHPFEWLMDFDRLDVEPLLSRRCAYILHGHMHRTGINLNINPDSETRVIAAGACYETRHLPNTYNFVKLDLNAGKGMAYLRVYSDEQGGFWTSNTAVYRNAPTGVCYFDLPNALHLMDLQV